MLLADYRRVELNMNNAEVSIQLKNWYIGAQDWQKFVFSEVLKQDLSKNTLDEISYSVYEFINSGEKFNVSWSELDVNKILGISQGSFLLSNLKDVQGVGILDKDETLEFKKNLNVVYGPNGSGKSSYIEIIKSIFNSKGKTQVRDDAFSNESILPTVSIGYIFNGNNQETVFNLTEKSSLPKLTVFDSFSPKIYIQRGNQIFFEPYILKIFTLLANIASNVKELINSDINKIKEAKVEIPASLHKSKLCNIYKNEYKNENFNKLEEISVWENTDETTLNNLQKMVGIKDYSKIIFQSKGQINVLKVFLEDIKNLLTLFTPAKIDHLSALEENIKSVSDNLKQEADNSLSQSKLPLFNNRYWQTMWEDAEKYKRSLSQSTKNSSINSMCVLCQQPLSRETASRMSTFSAFLNSNLPVQKEKLEQNLIYEKKVFINYSTSAFIKSLNAVKGIVQIPDDLKSELNCLWQKIVALLSAIKEKKFSKLYKPNMQPFVQLKELVLTEIADKEKFINQATEFSKKTASIKPEIIELSFKKWAFDNKAEITKAEKICKLKKFQKLFNTRGITSAKEKLSGEIVTQSYIDTFNSYLKKLNADSLRVKMNTESRQGRVNVCIVLKDAKKNYAPDEVLSTGQLTMVSLAAYFAEMTILGLKLPIILDDPVSSLDQEYELSVAKCLGALSSSRQVIVFTHRLSFLEALKDSIDNKKNINEITLRTNPVGAIDKPVASNVIKCINEISSNLNKAKNYLDDSNYNDYEICMSSIGKNFRNTIEDAVEKYALCDIVTRFRREVHTKNLRYLILLKKEDIQLLMRLMTEYSFTDHSQPSDTHIASKTINDVRNDLNDLKEFCERIKKGEGEIDKGNYSSLA